MSVLRSGLHYLAGQRDVQRLVTGNRVSARLARRFVAGERIEDAVQAVRALNAEGRRATVAYLGEAVTDLRLADEAAETICELLRLFRRERLDSNVSVKPTQLGLDVDEARCREHLDRVVALAAELDNFVRLDMESSAYTQRTLDLFDWLDRRYPGRSGVVIQAYLRRSEADIEWLIARGARVRLCKGAYHEPPEIAFPDKAEVDRNFVRLARALLDRGNYPAFATHDESIITFVRDYAARHDIAPARFEFQMLYGVRRDLQRALVEAGYTVRVYTPFGDQWYPYFMRRLAERPANLMFVLSSLAREGRAGRPD